MVDLSSLNANQLEAVNWTDGPLLVLAGPGSGKTRILTYRIARIVEDSQGKPFRILGLTFTNRAASEMNTRIQGLVPNARNRIRLTTFHSFCVDSPPANTGTTLASAPISLFCPQDVDREAVLDEAIDVVRGDHPEGFS